MPAPKRLPAGTEVVSVAGMAGVVVRHVPGADGGVYVVRWENGHTGRIAPRNITPKPRLGLVY